MVQGAPILSLRGRFKANDLGCRFDPIQWIVGSVRTQWRVVNMVGACKCRHGPSRRLHRDELVGLVGISIIEKLLDWIGPARDVP